MLPFRYQGSMFFLTPDGIPSVLVIRTQYDVESLAKEIQEKEPGFPVHLINDIKAGKKLLFIEMLEDKIPVFDFPKYLYKGNELELGLPYKLYYALIRKNIPGFDSSKVYSYEGHLKSINAQAPSGKTH